MDLSDLTKKIEEVSQNYAKEYRIKRDSDWFILKLQEELGELTQAYLMLTKKARKKGMSDGEIKKEFEKEVADVVCHALLLSHHHKVKLEEVIQKKWLSRLRK